jgi:hypothetical protein
VTSERLRDLLIRRASNLVEWFSGTLKDREKRKQGEIQAAKLACVRYLGGDDSSCDDDDLVALWEAIESEMPNWIGNPDLLHDDLGLLGSPRWDAQEFVLVPGLMLAEKAVECLGSQSHKKHLFAASILVDATEAHDYWALCRGVDRCRNPDRRLEQMFRTIEDAAYSQWFRAKQRKQGREGARKRHQPMAELQAWTINEYGKGHWRSANKAAHELAASVIERGRAIGAYLSEENAQRTIAEWIRKSPSSG